MKKGCFKTTLTILAKLSLTFLVIQEASSTIHLLISIFADAVFEKTAQ